MSDEWSREDSLWRSMISQLFDTYLTLICGKLSDNIARQEAIIVERESLVAELCSLIAQYRTDDQLTAKITSNFLDIIRPQTYPIEY